VRVVSGNAGVESSTSTCVDRESDSIDAANPRSLSLPLSESIESTSKSEPPMMDHEAGEEGRDSAMSESEPVGWWMSPAMESTSDVSVVLYSDPSVVLESEGLASEAWKSEASVVGGVSSVRLARLERGSARVMLGRRR
jgi:hypothetical protein